MQHVLQSIPGLKVQIRVFLASLVQVDVLTFNMLLNVSRVKWIQALSMFRYFCNRNIQYNVITIGSVMKAARVSWCTSLQLLESTQHTSILANEIVMNSVLASVASSTWQMAISIFISASAICQVDVISYNTTMRSMPWSQSLQLLVQMAIGGSCVNVISLNTLLASRPPWKCTLTFLQQGEAFATFGQVDILTYNSCINTCPWIQVMALCQRLMARRLEMSIVTSTSVMAVTAKVGLWQQVTNTLDGITGTSKLNAQINGLGLNGEWVKSLWMVKECARSKVLTDIITWGSVIVACETLERWQRALSLCAEVKMQKSAEKNVIIFNASVCACAQGEQWEEALRLLQNATLCHMQLNILAFNSILTACSKAARWQESLKILSTLNQSGPSASIKSYNTVLDACRRSRGWHQVLQLFSELNSRKLQPDALTFDAVIEGMQADRCLERMSLLLQLAEGTAHTLALRSNWLNLTG